MTVGEITFDLSFGASPFLVTLGDASGLAPLPIPSDDAVARFQAAMNRGCESGEGRGDSRLTALADIGARPKEVVPASENPSRGIPVQTDEETEDAVVAPLGGRPLAVEDARDFSGRSPVIDAFAARERADAPIGRIVPEAPKRPIDYLLAAASRADLRAYREVGVPDVVVTREVREVREGSSLAPAAASVSVKDSTVSAVPGSAPAADAPKSVEQTVVIVEKKAVVNAPAIDVPVRDAEKPAAMEVQRTVRESSPSAPAVATVGIGAKAKTIPAAPGAVPAPNVVPAADTPKAVEQTVVVVEEKAVANAPTIDVPVRDAEKPAAMEGQRTVRESLPSAPAVETDGLGGKAKAVSAVPESHSLPEATLPTAASKTGVPDAAPVVASPGAHAIMPEHDPDDPETVTAAIQAASSPIVSLPSEMPAAAPEISAVSSAVAHAETTVETIDKIVDAVTTQMVVTLGSVHGEGNVRIILKPTVLDGSEISMTAKDGALSVAIMPATPEAARLAAAAMPRLETALAEHVSAFRHVAVAIVQRKSK